MSWTCLACGRESNEQLDRCMCGHHLDESFLTENEERETGTTTVEVPDKPHDTKVERNIIKAVDSWMFTFSESDKCICIGTPALQSFRLKLTLDDLEELLEFVYRKTGKEKTTRKLKISADEMPDLIEKVYKLIEDKKSKVPVKFSNSELKEMANLINKKLKG
jgi:hypothetical protein